MLVSVVVITYNSEKTVNETLESISNQEYDDIELIISDDCSKDNTVEICNKWIKLHENRFLRSNIVTSTENTGVSQNLNRGIEYASGEWIKIIAGDDLLLPNCISDNVHYVSQYVDANVIFSGQQPFSVVDGKMLLGRKPSGAPLVSFCKLSAKEQFLSLLESNKLPAPTVFIKKALFNHFSYNPLYKYMDDIPMWINLSKNGVKLYFFDRTTVYYRIADSLSNTRNNCYFSERLFESERLFFELERGPYMLEEGLRDTYIKYRTSFLLKELRLAILGNRRSRIHDFISFLLKRFVVLFAKYSTI